MRWLMTGSYTQQLIRALAYCHSNNVVHRDIKGKNILVDIKGNVKLCDFGSAKRFDSKACAYASEHELQVESATWYHRLHYERLCQHDIQLHAAVDSSGSAEWSV